MYPLPIDLLAAFSGRNNNPNSILPSLSTSVPPSPVAFHFVLGLTKHKATQRSWWLQLFNEEGRTSKGRQPPPPNAKPRGGVSDGTAAAAAGFRCPRRRFWPWPRSSGEGRRRSATAASTRARCSTTGLSNVRVVVGGAAHS